MSVKSLNAFLAVALSVITFLIGKEYFPRIIDRPVVVEKEVKVPIEVRVEVPVVKEVVKEVIKEVPAQLTPEQSDALLTYRRIKATSASYSGPTDSGILPFTDGKPHPEMSMAPTISLNSDKIRIVINLSGKAEECCDKDEIFAIIRRRLQQAGFECEMASSDFNKAMYQSTNTLMVQVRILETSQYAYCGVVSTSFLQRAIGMNASAQPAVGPWKKFTVTPVNEDILIRAGKTVANSYIRETIDTQLTAVCSAMARELK